MSKLKPFINLGPGEAIREELEYYGWEQKDFAEIMERSEKYISQLITNKAPVTYEAACQLSKVFGQSTQFWLNLDAKYRDRLQESAKVVETEARALMYRYMPIRELRKKIGMPTKTEQLVDAVKAFWDIEELDFAFLDSQVQVCFRKSEAYRNFNPYYAMSWLQLARNSLRGRRPKAKYNPTRLNELAQDIVDYSVAPNGVENFINELARCGVIFLQQDHFEQTYIDGAAFFDKSRPVIVYTARHDRSDNFWFTMAHEIGHVLLHEDQQGVFIDSMDHLDLTDEREKEADDFAGGVLKSDAILKAFHGVKRPSSVKVQVVASDLGVHSGIVAGCLQHHKIASYKSFHEFKHPVRAILKD